MKNYLRIIVSLLMLFVLFSCSEDDSSPTEPNEDTDAASFYPGQVGSSYKYQGEVQDSSGSMQTERNSTFTSQQTFEGTTYIEQSNIITSGGIESTGSLFFRRSEKGVYVYINSQIFTDLLDSLDIDASQINYTVDPEITLISYPFTTEEWVAFSVNIQSYAGFPVGNIAVVELKGIYQGEESIFVDAADETLNAKKIRYSGKVGLPDVLSAFITDFPSVEVSATAWFVEDIGLVKTSGSAFIIGAIAGGDIALGDSSAVIEENLVEFNIE